jgi:hypothetical protein
MGEHEDDFDRLADRDAQYGRLIQRGRRRMTVTFVAWFIPVPFVTVWLQRRAGYAATPSMYVLQIVGGSVGLWLGLRHFRSQPDSAESLAIMGRPRWRRSMYRTLRRGEAITDYAELSELEAMNAQLRRGLPFVIVASVLMAICGPVLLLASDFDVLPTWALVGMLALLGLLVVQQIWIVRRLRIVIERSHEDP